METDFFQVNDSKEQWPHKKLTQTCLWVSRSLWQRSGSLVACCRVGGTEWGSACMGPFEGGHCYLHYLHHILVSDQTMGKEHSPTHQQKIGLKTYWAWPCPSAQDPVSPSVRLSHQEASISLYSFSIRGQTEWNPQLQNHLKARWNTNIVSANISFLIVKDKLKLI